MQHQPLGIPDRYKKRDCYWVYGPTGCGKTHYVYWLHKDIHPYTKNHSDEKILFDDVDNKRIYRTLIEATETCYGPLDFEGPSVVIVTSNYQMEELFKGLQLERLSRRFKEVTLDQFKSMNKQ